MSSHQEIRILQWNCHSLSNKLSNLKLHIYSTKPHVVCLSETWLSENFEPTFVNYSAIYKHRGALQAGGGLAVLVRSDVTYLEHDLQLFPLGLLEVTAIKIYLKNSNTPVSILSLYNPNRNVTRQEFEHYFSQLEPSCLIVGDFNAHSPAWEPGKTPNQSGRNLENILLNNARLALLTPPSSPTFFSVYHNSFSTLDLSIISTNLLPLASVHIEMDLGSDHYPVATNIGAEASTVRYKRRPTWKFNGGSWGAWLTALHQRETAPSLDVEAGSVKFSENIVSASTQVFPQSKAIITPKYSKSWWTQSCTQAVEAKRDAKRALISQPSPTNLIAYKRSEARVKWEVKQAKQNSWRRYCSTITSNTPISQLWKKVKYLRTPFVRRSQPFVLQNSIVTDSLRKAQVLSLHYEEIFTCPAPIPYPSHIVLPLALALCDDSQLTTK
jgi:hypothetical protein